MPLTLDQLAGQIGEAVQPDFRDKLVSRGLSRSILWTDGVLPQGSPVFSATLTQDLASYGFGLFDLCLRLREIDPTHELLALGFERSAEALEAVVRRGDPAMPERGFFMIVAAASYHIGRYSARAFSLLAHAQSLNLSPAESVLGSLLVRNLTAIRSTSERLADLNGFDGALAAELQTNPTEFDPERALQLLMNTQFSRAMAYFEHALLTGNANSRETALVAVRGGIAAASDFAHVTFWWIFTIARHLFDELWSMSLHVRLPNPGGDPAAGGWTTLRKCFVATLAKRSLAEIDLWPSQIEAASRAFDVADDLVVSLPTSAGKTRIAEICILRTLSLGQRVFFVTPLRALSAQTERTLRRTFVPLGYTISSLYGSSGMTGNDIDSLNNRDVVVSTPEKLDFALRNDPELLDEVGLVVLDEGHLIGTGEREIRYEVLVQRLLRRADAADRRIVCLSALLPSGPELDDFVAWLRHDQAGKPVACDWRATRQRFGYAVWQRDRARLTFRVGAERPFVPSFIVDQPPVVARRKKNFPQNSQEFTLACASRFVAQGQTVLVYCPQKSSVESLAEEALVLNRQGHFPSVLGRDESVLAEAMNIGAEWLGTNHPAVQCLRLGVAVHHGALPRPFQRAVEKLLKDEVLKITIASPTLAQGLNLSATTLLFHSLYRHGEVIPAEEFVNVAGRAGRAFVDVEGQVVCVDFDNKLTFPWNGLLEAAKVRSVSSGLLRLVASLCLRIHEKTNFALDSVVDYVTSNAAVWDPPQPTKFEPKRPQIWEDELARVDAALLALLPHDTAVDVLPAALDEVLSSSLWARSLKRSALKSQAEATAFLRARANLVWSSTTFLQRRGAFFAGVGFKTGNDLTTHAPTLNALLVAADAALSEGDINQGVAKIIEFARIAFVIRPFAPDELPAGWEALASDWMRGKSFADLAGQIESEIVEFLEGTLVYRLVWALEAVRVRAIAMGELIEELLTGRAALAVETGTPLVSASVLIHCGFSSRVAAIKAVSETRATFDDAAGMRAWIETADVQHLTERADWPTPSTARLWRDFLATLPVEAIGRWEIVPLDVPVSWLGAPPPPGTGVRVFNGNEVRSVEWELVGKLGSTFEFDDSGILVASVSPDSHNIVGEWIGPRGRFRSASETSRSRLADFSNGEYLNYLRSLSQRDLEIEIDGKIADSSHRIVDEDQVGGVIATTNAFGWDVDHYEIETIRLEDDACWVTLSWQASGEQDEDRSYFGDTIVGSAVAVIDGFGRVEYEELSAQVEDDYEPED